MGPKQKSQLFTGQLLNGCYIFRMKADRMVRLLIPPHLICRGLCKSCNHQAHQHVSMSLTWTAMFYGKRVPDSGWQVAVIGTGGHTGRQIQLPVGRSPRPSLIPSQWLNQAGQGIDRLKHACGGRAMQEEWGWSLVEEICEFRGCGGQPEFYCLMIIFIWHGKHIVTLWLLSPCDLLTL